MQLLIHDPLGPEQWKGRAWGFHVFLKIGGEIWDDKIRRVAECGMVPIVTLEPWGGLGAVIQARYDQWFWELIAILAHNTDDYYYRFAHEMNGDWYPWGQQPALYRTAHRRVRGWMGEGRDIFCPNRIYSDDPLVADIWQYTDYDLNHPSKGPTVFGLDAYPKTGHGPMKTPGKTFGRTLDLLNGANRPLWICETGVDTNLMGADGLIVNDWLTTALDGMEKYGVEVFGYFNADRSEGASGNYRLRGSDAQLLRI